MLTANVLCLKKKKRRTYSLSNANRCRSGFEAGCSKNERSRAGTVTMMQITEDTPPDMLAGAMDLTVHLPNGRSTKMSIERSTPMMDLLVQITVANHLQLSNHTLQALGMAPSLEHSDIVLPFKPNTPIGALDTQHVRVLPKEKTLPAPKYIAPGHQPFESTFRLKVHLPRNQLYVTRVSRNVLLEDIMKKVCEEKNLDPVKYEFKHPGNLDTVLNPKLTLSDYQITEIYVVAKGTANLNQAFSTADIMSLRKEEERKQMHNKTGGGVFNLIFKRGKSSMGSGSVSSDNRSISPTHSDDSRSVTPPAVQAPPIVALPKKDPPPERPKPPQRKRRPAPKPPQIQISDTRSEDSGDKNEAVAGRAELPQEPPPKKASDNGLTICHSRNSSDSSGYHEASILSDHCANTSLPRSRPKSAYVGGSELPAQSTSNLGRMAVHSRSTTSLVTGRRKKAAPPPPPLAISPASSVITQSEKPSPLVASQSDITVTAESITSTNYTPGQTPFDSLPLESSTPVKNQPEDKSLESTDSGIAQDAQSEKEKESDEDLRLGTPPPPPILDDIPNEINYSNQPQKLPEISAEVNFSSKGDTQPKSESELPDSFTKQQVPVSEPPPLVIQEAEVADVDWQYQLPSPPKAFRDSSPPTFLQNETNTVSDFKDSVVTSPELFEKLKILEDNQSENGTLTSDITSIASDDPLNSLSLEHLEKRKSLVYNRELSTSLKMTDSLESKSRNMDNFTSMTGNFQPKYESRRASTDSQKQPVKPTRTTVGQSQNHHTLPNFKISTYDVPKQNITVFEDDTIRSNTHSSTTTSRTHTGKAVENIPIFNKKQTSVSEEKEYKFYKPTPTNFGSFSSVARSGSFSIDSRFAGKPVSRSKSSLTLNKYQADNKGQESISRSNSLFDVSGLQSLEVMKLIQNKLSTPTGSMENISYKEKITVPQKQVANVEVTPKEPTKIPDFEILKEKTPHSPEPVKKYYYRGPPAVNMTTWSERPKVPVAVKEDEDYKLGNMNVSSKLIVKTTNNDMASNNTVEVKSNGLERNVNVHINGKLTTNSRNHNAIGSGSEQITQKSGNVIIKIGSANDSNNYIRKLDNKHFVDPPVYRKAFTNINRNDGFLHSNQRPHSIAFDSEFDPSRVPVVRSVELKKQYKNMHNTNTSVTHISGNDIVNHEYQNNKYTDTFVEKFRSTENLRHSEKQESEPNRKVFRVNSIKPAEHQPSTPTVRGFRNPSTNTNTNNRFSWHVSTNYGTLPHKPILEKEYNTNQNVPFSQSNLRRTESSKLIKTDANSNDIESSGRLPKPTMENVSTRNKLIVTQGPPPPPPPQIPKVALKKPTPVESKINSQPTDARDMLLESIRNFGGKKGLKTVKA
ncbi:cordon-bleu protein-like 1 isoform X5 [Sitophilus oryzae]|uniref:Cordon-bleu protein-like 1 isoform X5 n=1 Tax=Sitophilus oryzae TaxID=7048 RepID=A0A6J2YN19_SITOR|nr:cordon-bleu protein-like 1 isoform X5 [Sitophilus oryzae]